MLGLLRLRGYRRLLGLRFATQWGDGMFQAALGGAVLFNPERQADPLAVAAGLAVLLMPYSRGGPVRRHPAGPVGPPPGARHRQRGAGGAGRRGGGGRRRGRRRARPLPRRAGRDGVQPVRAGRAVGRAAARRREAPSRGGQHAGRDGGRGRLGARRGLRDRPADARRVGQHRLGDHNGRRGRRAAGRRAGRHRVPPPQPRPGRAERAVAHRRWRCCAASSTARRAVAANPSIAASFAGLAAHRLAFGISTLLTLLLYRYAFTDIGPLRAGLPGIGEAVAVAAAGAAVRRARHAAAGAPVRAAVDDPGGAGRRLRAPSSARPAARACPSCSSRRS